MKKIIVVCLICLMMLTFMTGCNENWGIGNYSYHHVHVSDSVTGYCATIESWHDNELGIELHTIEFGDVYLSEGTYMLFNEADGCPYCSED